MLLIVAYLLSAGYSVLVHRSRSVVDHARPAGLVIKPVCLSVCSGLLVPSLGDVENLELVQIKADACCGFIEGETRRLIQKSLMVTETSDTF